MRKILVSVLLLASSVIGQDLIEDDSAFFNNHHDSLYLQPSKPALSQIDQPEEIPGIQIQLNQNYLAEFIIGSAN